MEPFSYPVEMRDLDGRPIRVLRSLSSQPIATPEQAVPVISVIIPAFGRPEHVRECLASLFRSPRRTVPFEAIVVDDNPGCRVRDCVPAGVAYVENPGNLGFAGACNAGAAIAGGRWLLFLNSDTRVLEPAGDWLLKMMSTAQDLMADVVGCKLLYPQSLKTQHAGMFPDGEGTFAHGRKNLAENDPQVSRDEHMLAVSGACMLVHRSAWERLGGFSTDFGGGYFEDVDLCLRWIESGGRVGYCGSTRIAHHESASIGPERGRLIESAAAVFRSKWPAERNERIETSQAIVPCVDVIVPVFNACRSAIDCIRSIRERTPGWIDCNLIVVNDCSDEHTARRLRELSGEDELDFRLLELPRNSGYLPAIAEATKASKAPWVCYVNSDVVVTRGWLAAMLHAAESDPAIRCVNPYTTSAAHLSVRPPSGSNYRDMARRVLVASERRRFDIVTPVGFCMLVERRALEECGGWDVGYYGRGYGEECDLFMRLRERGYRSVMADDAFVLHEGGRSFGQQGVQKEFEFAGYQRFMARWKDKAVPLLAEFNRRSPQFYVMPEVERLPNQRRRIVFVFRDASICGGVLAVVHLCNRLIELGWDATFACTHMRPIDESLLGARFSPMLFGSREELVRGLSGSLGTDDVIVATIWATTDEVSQVRGRRPDVRAAYFVQDVEYMFTFPSGAFCNKTSEVVASYDLIPEMVVNSDWVRDVLLKHGHDAHKIGIGVDPDMFYPGEIADPRIVMAHCRPSTPRRGWQFIRSVFEEVRARRPGIRFRVYDQQPEGALRWVESLGRVSPQKLAQEMRKAAVFIEGSTFQAWGMQAMEAMASGATLVSTANLGIDNYGTNGWDCLVVAPGDVKAATEYVTYLLDNPEERSKFASNARQTALRFGWDSIAREWDRWLKERFPC